MIYSSFGMVAAPFKTAPATASLVTQLLWWRCILKNVWENDVFYFSWTDWRSRWGWSCEKPKFLASITQPKPFYCFFVALMLKLFWRWLFGRAWQEAGGEAIPNELLIELLRCLLGSYCSFVCYLSLKYLLLEMDAWFILLDRVVESWSLAFSSSVQEDACNFFSWK